jgi:nucleotide-binding universal stress UspA family protein
MMYNKILVPLDGSKLSESAINHLRTIIEGNFKVEIIFLTVIESVSPQLFENLYGAPLGTISDIAQEESAEIRQKAKDYLDKIADSLKKEGFAVKTVVKKAPIAQGPAETIIDYAKDNKVELIIMSTHGRSGISRWTLGSVTDKVIRHAGIPVLTASPEELKT